MVTMTPTALVELKRLAELKDQQPVLRVSVEAGGCSGLQYQMDFDVEIKDTDQIFEEDGVKIIVDVKSLPHLEGMQVDFSKALINGGFKFINPNATQSCSCGQSFTT